MVRIGDCGSLDLGSIPSGRPIFFFKMEQWNPDQNFLQFIRDISPPGNITRFVVHGEKKTLCDLLHEMELGTFWGRGVYLPLYQAYSHDGPLQQQYQSWQEQQSR